MQRSTQHTDGCEIVRQVWLARVTDGGAGFRIISDVGKIAAGILMSHVVTPDDGSGGAND